ncbi:MAG: M56 family metallopeptidase [Mariniblastus sp.]
MLVSLLEISWATTVLQVTTLTALGFLVGKVLQKKSPSLAASTALIALVASGILVLAALLEVPRVLEFHLPVSQSATTLPTAAMSNGQSDPAAQAISLAALSPNIELSLSPTQQPEHRQVYSELFRAVNISSFAAIAFSVSLIFCIARLLLSTLHAVSVVRASHPVQSSEIIELFNEVQLRSLPSRGLIQLNFFDGTESPFVFVFAPNTIFLPSSFTSWHVEEQRASLAHELAHIERRDTLWRLVAELSRMLVFLHPVAFLLYRQIELSQELAADQQAAEKTLSTSEYCRGLARLALRFDRQFQNPNRGLGVAISSSLIRRITMLKGFEFTNCGHSTITSKIAVAVMAVVCCSMCCWTVQAQTADETAQRKPATIATVGHTEPIKPFSYTAAEPWTEMGYFGGYLSVRPEVIFERPEFGELKNHFQSVLNGAVKSKAGIADFGLSVENIKLVNASIHLGDHGISIGSPAMSVHAGSIVDWPGMISAFDYQLSAESKIDMKVYKEQLLKNAAKSKSNVFSFGQAVEDKEKQKLNPVRRSVWNFVSGGFGTAMYDSNKMLEGIIQPNDAKERDAVEQSISKITAKVKTFGFGVDFHPDGNSTRVRIALVPKANSSATEVCRFLNQAKENAKLQIESADSTPEDKETLDTMNQLMKQISSAEISISQVESKESTKNEIIKIELELDIAWEEYLKLL